MSDKVLISVESKETINLELINPNLKYSNAQIGTSAQTYAEDTPEGREEARRILGAEVAEYMEAERNQLIEDLKGE